jgi:hypothetical protein
MFAVHPLQRQRDHQGGGRVFDAGGAVEGSDAGDRPPHSRRGFAGGHGVDEGGHRFRRGRQGWVHQPVKIATSARSARSVLRA